MRDLVAEVHAPDGPDVVPLHQAPEDRPGGEQDEGHLDGQLGVQVPFLPVEPVLLQHHDHGEAQAAQEHAEHERDEDPQVGLVGDDAVRMRREAGVVEGRNRVEDAVPDRLPERLAQGQEPRDQGQCQDGLDHDGRHDDDPQQRAHFTEPAGVVHGLLGDELAADAELLAHHEGQQRREGQGAQAAHEDADQDDQLAEEGPVHRRRNDRQARDADCGHRREEGLVQRRGLRPWRTTPAGRAAR